MLGDGDSDVLAGHAAGCRAVLIEHPGSAHKRAAEVSPDLLASNLADGVAQLLEERLRPPRPPRRLVR
jgi:phosphoglycolate phosphatase-like HAD superfamily hydrolase